MTPEQYVLYASLFDALRAARRDDSRQTLCLFGDVAGAALRRWADERGLDVASEVLGGESTGHAWTVLRFEESHGGAVHAISVHLDDDIPVATRAA